MENLQPEEFEIRKRKPKVLFFDIETAPNLSYVWGQYEQNVIEHVQESYVLAWCAKWQDGKVISRCLADYEGYTAGSEDDKALITELWHLFNEAQVIVGHNGDRFDIRRVNARFIEHGLTPPEPYKTIDTLKISKKNFGFNTHKLDDLGRRLGVGRKVKHSGFELWKGCMTGDEKAWSLMKKYNKGDVELLMRVYEKLRPWSPANHPNMSILSGVSNGCPKCGSLNLQRRGYNISATGRSQRFQCQDCSAWSSGKHQKVTEVR